MKLSCNIGDLRVHVLMPNGVWRWLSIDESPYHVALQQGNRARFTLYNERLIDYRAGNWRGEKSYVDFMALSESIKKNGFKVELGDCILSKYDNPLQITEGQHRLVALLFHYGPNTMLHFKDGELEKVTYGGDQSDS